MKDLKETTLALAAALEPFTTRRDGIPLDSLLIERAVREGVAGILYKSLLTSGRLECLCRAHKETLQAYYYQTLRMNLLLIHALKQVLFQTNQKGVAVVVLQGMDLLNEPYEDIGLRPMTDIDLWVSKKDYEKIVQILGGLDYERDAVYPNNFKQGSVLFDVHTHILWADRIRARKLLLGRSEEHLLGRVKEIQIEDQKALRLTAYDQVLYLSLHAFKHRVERLIWLVDIKRIMERWSTADWENFVRRAVDLKQGKTVTYLLFLLKQFFYVKIPEESQKLVQGRTLGPIERKILRERLAKGALPPWGPALLFSSQLRLGRRLVFLFETLFPRTDVLRQVFPSPPSLKPWQLYVKRALQLLNKLKTAAKEF